jgi:hypothetical protein
MKNVALTIVATVAGLALLVGLWFGGWALAGLNQTKQYEVNTNSQQFQGGLVSQERDRVAGYDAAVDPAQKDNIKQTFCTVFADLKPAPEDLVLAQSRICN